MFVYFIFIYLYIYMRTDLFVVIYKIFTSHIIISKCAQFSCLIDSLVFLYFLLTGYVNNFHHRIVFQCPSGGFINGMHSYHHDKPEDRRWKFYCCRKPRKHLFVFMSYFQHFFKNVLWFLSICYFILFFWGGKRCVWRYVDLCGARP